MSGLIVLNVSLSSLTPRLHGSLWRSTGTGPRGSPRCPNFEETHRSDLAPHDWQVEILGSVRLRARKLHDFGPLFGFAGKEFPEIVGGAPERFAPEIEKASLHSGIAEGTIDLAVELADDLCRGVIRSADTLPRTRLVAGYKLAYCGDIGQRL